MKNKILFVFLTLVLVVSLVAFGACKAAPAEKEPIKIGGLYSMTGFLSTLGLDANKAATLYLEQAGYEIAGRPVEYIAEDIASDATVCMDKARKLVETDKVCIIDGPILTPGIDAIGPYLTRMNVPFLSNSCLTEYEALAGWTVWGHPGDLHQRTATAGHYAYHELGYRKIATLGNDYVAGYEYMAGFVKGFEEAGGEIVQQQWFAMDTLDFTPYIINLAEADALATCIIGPSIPAFGQFRELGVYDKMDVIVATDAGLFDDIVLKEIGEKAVGVVGESHYHFSSTAPGNKEFVDAYRAKYGVTPPAYAGMAYMSMQIIGDAIERTGGDVSFEALSKALDETDLETIRGRISFTPERLGKCDSQIAEIVDPTTVATIATYHSTSERVGDELVVTVERTD